MAHIFRNRWWLIVGSVIGLMVSTGPINIFTFGVFLRAMTADLGIGRGGLASALLVASILSAVVLPFVGMMLDRWGARRVLLPGIVLYAVVTAAQALITASFATLYLLFALKGIAGGGNSPVAYAHAIAKRFDHNRGFALGIAMAGVGLGTSIVPLLVATMIEHWGWRMAYVGLGVFLLIVAGLPVLAFVREPQPDTSARAKQAATALLPGFAVGAVLKSSWRFWGLTVGFLLAVVALNGIITQIVAILQDRGASLQAATSVLAASGIAAIVGRIVSGWLVDRLFAPFVGIAFFVLAMIGIALVGTGAGGMVPLIGIILCGLTLGAEIDLMAFLVTRYFGLKAYGKIFGTMFGFFAGATGLGPVISGYSFDVYHSYVPAFVLYEVMLVATCAMLVRLGPYPFPARPRAAEGAVADAVSA